MYTLVTKMYLTKLFDSKDAKDVGERSNIKKRSNDIRDINIETENGGASKIVCILSMYNHQGEELRMNFLLP